MTSKYCASITSPTAQFWNSYIRMVSLLLLFIETSREGNWQAHLPCIRSMFPFMFAYDRVPYSRFLSFYWLSMTHLPVSHPAAHADLQNGDFCVQRSQSKRQVPFDLTVEQTINRYTKTAGGIIGISRKPGAVHRLMVTAHKKAYMTRSCRAMAGAATKSRTTHPEVQPTNTQRSEAAVEAVTSTLGSWQNPFGLTDD